MSAIDLDQPKFEQSQDRFQRYGFSKRIANMIGHNHLEKSLVIGLYGKWGEGKTSVMNFIKKELPSDTVIINFNPWLFSDQERLLTAFFNNIATALDQSINKPKEKIAEALSTYAGLIGTLTKKAGWSLEGLVKIGEKFSTVSIETLKERLDDIIQKSRKRIVVFIDDIDRLETKEVQYIFKLVKLVADFPSSTYIMAFDDDMVATALSPVYGNGQKANGYQFLEKIIQIPIRIPKATKPALRNYTYDLVTKVFNELRLEIKEADLMRFKNAFEESFIPIIDNPRLAIRYANSLFFALPLLTGEVNTCDLLLSEGLKVFFPEAFDFMRKNGPLFLTDDTRGSENKFLNRPVRGDITTKISNFFKETNTNEETFIRGVWAVLFPQYGSHARNAFYGEDSWKAWYQERRMCSGKYFERYFTYSVIEGDLSDILFDEFLGELEFLSVDESLDKITTMLEKVSFPDIMFKIRLWEDRLNSQQSQNLAALIIKLAEGYPAEAGTLNPFTTRGESARVIAQLAINQGAGKIADQLLLVMSMSTDLQFAMEISYSLFNKNKEADYQFFTEPDELRIKGYLIQRFKFVYDGSNFFELLPDLDLLRLLLWWNKINAAEQIKVVMDEIAKGSDRAVKLIKVFTPTVTIFGAPVETYKGGFDQKQFELMASVTDPVIIYKILKANGYEAANVALELITTDVRYSDRELAGIFVQFYERHLEQNGT